MKIFQVYKNKELIKITILGISLSIKRKKINYFNIQKEHHLLYEKNSNKPWNKDFINTNWYILAPNIYDIHQIKLLPNFDRKYNTKKNKIPILKNYNYIIYSCSPLNYLPFPKITKIINQNSNLIFTEDSFLRSVHLYYARKNIDDKYTKPLSFMFDDLGFHFSCYYPTRIELLLKNSPELTIEEKNRAQKNIKTIRENYLTKYNYKPINIDFKLPGKNKEKILVIGQKNNDASITNSNVPNNIFDIILLSAIQENPNADILFVDHPENKHNNLPNGLSLSDVPNLYMLNNETNIPVLLESVNKVYVCSSGVGLESIIRGKETIVFGCPFYAGWGLTDDRNELMQSENMKNRRNKKLTIEDIFYRAYIDYTIYKMPNEVEICEIEQVLEYLIKTRQEYFDDIKDGKINPLFN